jgi:NhaP-type Na+/H+ or K+/H+ antiporter
VLVAKEISIGLAAGLLLTVAAGWLLKFAWRRQWLTETWIQIPIVALALVCFATAQLLGGSGFIAAFSGELLFGALAKKHRQEFLRTVEGTGDTLALITWVIFGAAMISHAIGHFNWIILLYAVLSLTLIRMLPVFLVEKMPFAGTLYVAFVTGLDHRLRRYYCQNPFRTMGSRPDRVGRHPFYRTDGCRIGACGSGKHEGNAEA